MPPKQPLVSGNRSGEKCRDSEADVTAVGVSATIATYRCRPGLSVRRIVFTEASGTLRIVAKLFAFISVIITGA